MIFTYLTTDHVRWECHLTEVTNRKMTQVRNEFAEAYQRMRKAEQALKQQQQMVEQQAVVYARLETQTRHSDNGLWKVDF